MNTIKNEKRNAVSYEELLKFYKNKFKIEEDIISNRDKVMQHQLHKVTGGKKIIITNCPG